jgi:hypothetical protein
MGMFDEIKCEYREMPAEHRARTYQTKSLYNCLENYRIDEDGKLWAEQFEIEEVDNPDYDSTKRFSFPKIQERKNIEWVERPMTQTIRFYDFDDENYVRLQYVATYVKGKLVHFEKEEESNDF